MTATNPCARAVVSHGTPMTLWQPSIIAQTTLPTSMATCANPVKIYRFAVILMTASQAGLKVMTKSGRAMIVNAALSLTASWRVPSSGKRPSAAKRRVSADSAAVTLNARNPSPKETKKGGSLCTRCAAATLTATDPLIKSRVAISKHSLICQKN